jgi:UPF0716 protein FxsA
MVGLLIVLFIVVPIVELAVFVQVSGMIGFLPSLLLVVTFSLAGAWLVKREGLGVMRRVQAQLQRGETPAVDIVNGLLILVAGALMLFPGFVTDIIGLLLLIPPTRALVRVVLMRRFERNIRALFESPAAIVLGGDLGGFAGTDDLGMSRRRVFTGPATYGAVYDVHEVITDDAPGSDRSSPSSSPRPPADPPELGRY